MQNSQNPLRRQPQQKRSQKRVEQILDAAAFLFDEIGYEATTTHAIASRANTSVGSLYQFFPDKLAIFNALELRHVNRVHQMWEQLSKPEVIQGSFVDFIHTIVAQCQKLFEQPTSRIIFVQFFTSPTIFKNIDHSFTQEVINFTASLFQKRNPYLSEHRSHLLAEICTHGINTLILLALRSEESRRQQIFIEIEILLQAYLKNDLDDEMILNRTKAFWRQSRGDFALNQRQAMILQYLQHHDSITIQNCEAILPQVSRRTLQRDLKAMVEQKILTAQGNTDQRHYFLQISRQTRDNL